MHLHAVGTQWLVVMLADSYFAGMTPELRLPCQPRSYTGSIFAGALSSQLQEAGGREVDRANFPDRKLDLLPHKA